MTRKLTVAFATLGLVGCFGNYNAQDAAGGGTGTANGAGAGTATSTGTGTGTGTAPAPSDAQPLFDASVKPLLLADCASAGCHGGAGTSPIKFAGGDVANLYTTVLSFSDKLLGGDFDKSKAQILSKITVSNHNGVTYTADAISKIAAWLDRERTARAGTRMAANPRNLLLATFSGCMKQVDWDEAGVAKAWAQKTTDNTNTACQQCHVNGQGWLAGQDTGRIFNILTTVANPHGGWFMEYYFTVDSTDPANMKVVINRDLLTYAAMGTAQHERFKLDTDNGGGTPTAMERLKTFFDKAQANLAAGTCDPPRFTPVP